MNRVCIQKITPVQVGTCVLWLDGTNPSWAKDNTRPANGANVSPWKDQSGKTNDMSQGFVANQPLYNTATIGNNASVTFSGSRGFLGGTMTSLPTSLTARTIFVVCKSTNVATSQYPFMYGVNTTGNYFSVLVHTGSKLWCDAGGRNTIFDTTTLVNNTNYVFEVSVPTGATVVLDWTGRINGVDQTNINNASGAFSTYSGSYRIG
jgi:hypothetical protein